MKKLTLVATAVMGLWSASAAMAQSTMTLYGLVDAGYNHVSGLKNGSFNGIASGIMEGSRWGMRGNEDLGGGYKAIFTLESRFEADTGSVTNRPNSGTQLPDRVSSTVAANLPLALRGPAAAPGGPIALINSAIGTNAFGVNLAGNLFDRQAFAGLITPFGAFTLGRQYTPAYLVTGAFDASQTQSSLAAGQIASLPAAFDIRLSNTLQYGIKTGGITAALMYGAAETSATNPTGRFMGGLVMYQGDGFSAGFGHNERKNEFGQKSLTNNVLGATVDVGPGTLYGQYATIKDDNPSGLSPFFSPSGSLGALAPVFQNAYNTAFRQDARLMHVGYKVTSGAHAVVVAYNRLDDKRAVNADTDSYGATYTYALSKRTNLNAVLTRYNNKGSGQVAPGGNGFLGGVTASAGTDSTNVAFGIRHSF
ncbi:MAG: porin [Polaromonas sp.]